MFHFSSFRLKFLPCVYKVVLPVWVRIRRFFISSMSCRCPPAGSPTPSPSWGLKLSCGLKGIQSEGPASFQCQAETGWGAASMTNMASSWHKKGPCAAQCDLLQALLGWYPACAESGHGPLGSSLSTLQSCILLLFPSMSVTPTFMIIRIFFLAQDTHERNGLRPPVKDTELEYISSFFLMNLSLGLWFLLSTGNLGNDHPSPLKVLIL